MATVACKAETNGIRVIELHMMDKRKYFTLAALSGFCIRGMLYPVSLIRTRLQLQRQHSIYNGTFDAFVKILRNEGACGLYKGFWVSNLMIASQLTYVATYESVRQMLTRYGVSNTKAKSFVAGGCASLMGQTFMVPVDIVAQHLQMLGRSGMGRMKHLDPLDIPADAMKTRFGPVQAIVGLVYKQHGLRGFYKGYFASLAVYAPNSALWWFFYDIYCGKLSEHAPDWMPRLALQCTAAPLSGLSSSVITNPMDAIRARIQVENSTFLETARTLWREEHLGIFTKGLSARFIQSVTYSFFIILGYETVKRWSVLDEYKTNVRW